MRTLDRYILALFSKNLVVSFLSTVTLFWFQSVFSDLYSHQNPIKQILIYHAMGLPEISVQLTPAAVLLTTVLTLSGLARTQELVACYSIGVGLKRIMTLILITIGFVVCLVLLAQDKVLPSVFRTRTDYKYRVMEKKMDFFLDIKRDRIWYRSRNMIYNLQRFDPKNNTIYGMSIYTFDEHFNLVQVTDAQTAEYSASDWKLKDGTVALFSHEDPFPLLQEFKEKTIFISETPKDFMEIEKEVDGLRFKQLYEYIARMRFAGADTRAYEVKFHSRISVSFMPIVMCLLAVPFSLGLRREGGLARDLGFCLMATMLYWIAYSISLSLGTKGSLPPWFSAWLPSFIFMGLAGLLIARKQSA